MAGGRRLLRLVDVGIEIAWNHPGLQALAAQLYADAPAAEAPDDRSDVRVALRRDAAGDRLLVDGLAVPTGPTPGELFAQAEHAITDAAVRLLRTRYLLLHASCVAVDRRALLIVGGHDAGKTSLAVALARAGAEPLTDDVAPLAPTALVVEAFPRDFILHTGSLTSLPGTPPSPGFKCYDGYRFLAPSAACHRPPGERALAAGLLFPQRASGATTELRPVGAADAARRLLHQSFDLQALPAAAVDAVARLSQLPAAALVYDDAAAAVDGVREWWAREARGAAAAEPGSEPLRVNQGPVPPPGRR